MSAVAPVPATVLDPADLTPGWLTAALRAGGRAVTVTSVRPERVGTGQMAACYRLHVEAVADAGSDDTVPATLVAKIPPAGAGLGPVAAGAYRNEVAFYAELAPTVAVRAPACHYQAFDEEGGGFTLLLEDLAPARQGDQVAGCGRAEAEAAIVNVAGLHGPRWCDPSLAELPNMAAATADDAALLGEVVASATGMFCDRYEDRLAPADRALLHEAAEAIAAWATGRPERFGPVHGDYRLDNLLFPLDGGGPVTAVDWQTVSLGLPARDVAYFLGTSVPTRDRRAAEEAIVAAYHRALIDHGVTGYSVDDCLDDYRFAFLQGPLITVTGAIFSNRTERGDDMFMAMASRCCAAVRDHKTLDMI